MINYDKVAEKIFAIIKGHGFNLSMFTEDGMDTSEPAEGRRFYVKDPNFMVTLEEDADEIKINKNSNVTLEEIEGILKQMKNLAKQNLLNTQIKVFGKEIAPKDFAYQAQKYRTKDMSGISEASLSRMSGSKKTSYQTLESVKMIVRHRKAVDEDVRGSRSRQISAIFLEQAGERFRFPHNNLAGARAMARHMYEGGNMQDTIGEYIVESVGNIQKLVEFVRYTRSNKLINETSEDVIKTVKENIATMRGELKGLTGAKSYTRVSETITAREADVLEEDDTVELQDMFTVRKFDEKIGDMLPLVKRLMNEKAAWRAALIEASQQTIFMHEKEELAEEDIMEFDSPLQQVGYKIQKVAKRMIESGDLSRIVARAAGKLIEGESISDFEKTIVRNVMENAKIEESQCDECDGIGEVWGKACEKCGGEEKKDTVESIGDDFDRKMAMIEEEEIFVEGNDYKDCPDCNGGYTQDGKDCNTCEGNGKIDEGFDDHHAGEIEAGCGMGMPAADCNGNCPECGGTGEQRTGSDDTFPGLRYTCDRCGGDGNIDSAMHEGEKAGSGNVDPEDFMDDCPDCGGNGKAKDSIFDDDECTKCGGEGYV